MFSGLEGDKLIVLHATLLDTLIDRGHENLRSANAIGGNGITTSSDNCVRQANGRAKRQASGLDGGGQAGGQNQVETLHGNSIQLGGISVK